MTSANPKKPLNKIRLLLIKFFYSVYGKILGIIWIALVIICGLIQPDLPLWFLLILIAPLMVIVLPFSLAFVVVIGKLFFEWLSIPRSRWQWEIMIIDSIKALLIIAMVLGMLYGFILMDYLFE